MTKIKYSSFAEIDRDLEIIRLQKEIDYYKLVLSVQKTHEILTPEYVVKGFLEPYSKFFSTSFFTIGEKIVRSVLSWAFKRKKSDCF